jgi:hypothetical protein
MLELAATGPTSNAHCSVWKPVAHRVTPRMQLANIVLHGGGRSFQRHIDCVLSRRIRWIRKKPRFCYLLRRAPREVRLKVQLL